MFRRLFSARRQGFWDPGRSPVSGARQDKPHLSGRRAFIQDHVFVHTHIPKAGGTTLTHGLSNLVGAVNSMDLRLNRRVPLDEMTAADLHHLSLIAGHFGYGLHERLPGTPLYVATVREPVARFVSLYRFLTANRGKSDYREIANLDLADAWEKLRTNDLAGHDNIQARLLTGTGKGKSITERALHHQVEDGYFLIIPQTQLNEALRQLRIAFGTPGTRQARQNVSRGPEIDLPGDLTARILQANRLDAMLYQHACDTFAVHLDRACEYIASHCLLPLKDHST